MEENLNEWWGYKHINGTYQVKRYFGKRDLEEARESDFVDTVSDPFMAADRGDALEKIKERL